tara:strand:+ start:112 stop:261 length:150 start_codon:yes stop_codon:yes gene_type:complete
MKKISEVIELIRSEKNSKGRKHFDKFVQKKFDKNRKTINHKTLRQKTHI